MGNWEMMEKKPVILDSIIAIECNKCNKSRRITVRAVYRQSKRGNTKYICPSCSGRNGWRSDNKQLASNKSKQKWRDTSYAGTIIGKAIANDIKKSINSTK